jgi:tRNA nucleotidyltransferase/poly(A) polymerase
MNTPNVDYLCQLPLIKAVVVESKKLGIQPYLVGGSVRDAILSPEKPITDYDFLVLNGDAKTLVEQLVQLDVEDTRLITLDEHWGIFRWIILPKSPLHPLSTTDEDENLPPVWVDVANALDNELHTDLNRRDLTISALALHPETGEIIDVVGGLADLNNRHIRMISAHNLVDDPLRLLRVFRFMACLGEQHPTLDPATLACVQANTALLNTVAMERCHYEFLKMLSYPQAFPALQAMADCGLLEQLIPELTACRQVPPNSHHHLPLWEHTLELVRQTELLYTEVDEETLTILNAPVANMTNGWGLVKLGCLLHDIGKPATWEIIEHKDNPEGKHTFLGHEKVGEDLTDALLKRWKMSGELTALVKKLVRWHLYPCQFGQHSSRKSVLRFFRKLENHTPHVTVLALADRLSTCGVAISAETLATSKTNHLWLLKRYYEEQSVLQAPRLLSGETVMAILRIPPSQAVGQWLKRLEEAQQLGEITTATEATQWLVAQYRSVETLPTELAEQE